MPSAAVPMRSNGAAVSRRIGVPFRYGSSTQNFTDRALLTLAKTAIVPETLAPSSWLAGERVGWMESMISLLLDQYEPTLAPASSGGP